jgi:hypothetical protein
MEMHRLGKYELTNKRAKREDVQEVVRRFSKGEIDETVP